MKRTAGKSASEVILVGDRDLAKVLSRALHVDTEVSRWTHGFHTWPAGLHPDAAQILVRAFPGDSLLDPFNGGGTVLVEGIAAGRRVHGRDISPVALRIAKARSCVAEEVLLTKFRSRSRKLVAAAQEASARPHDGIYGVVSSWYAPHVVHELESLRVGIESSDADIRPLLEVCFSSILVKVSWRKSDTSNQREKHHRPPGTAAILFHKKCRELARRITALREDVPEGTPSADVRSCDARKVTVPEPVDLVLTSPPYPSTYDYLPMQHLRSVWLGDTRPDHLEIGARRDWRDGARTARKGWLADTFHWQKACADALKSGGHLVVVIGDGLSPAGTIDTAKPTEDAAIAAGLKPKARASVAREDHGRGTQRWEHVLVYEKP